MVCFCVSGIVAKVLKMLVFPVWGAFVWWLILVYLGLEGLGVLWFLFLLFFCSGFVFVCFGFGFVLLLDCCWCCSCFVIVLLFVFLFLFCFIFGLFLLVFLVPCYCFLFGGFKGQVRWPKGPPHLALNPPQYSFFVFFLLCFPFFAFLS